MTDQNQNNPFETKWDKIQNISKDGLSLDESGVLAALTTYHVFQIVLGNQIEKDLNLSTRGFHQIIAASAKSTINTEIITPRTTE